MHGSDSTEWIFTATGRRVCYVTAFSKQETPAGMMGLALRK
jgi:hypothetical protein